MVTETLDNTTHAPLDAQLDEQLDVVLDAELNEVAGFLNAQHARLVDVTDRLVANPLAWRGPGVWTVEQYLCWRTGISTAHAKQIARIAARVEEFPECMAVFTRGELSLDQMAAIVGRTPAWADHDVSELAPMMTVRQLQRVLGKYQYDESDNHADDQPSDVSSGKPADLAAGSDDTAMEPDPADDPGPDGAVEGPPVPDGHQPVGGAVPRPGPDDSCSFWFDDDGRFHLNLNGDQVTGKLIERALTEARDQLFNHGQADVTWTDALSEVCERSLDGVASPDRRNRWRINLFLNTDGRGTDETGYHLPDAIRRYITCDGLLSPVIIDNGIPVSVGHTQHIVPDRTRRIVIHRDGGCGVPGCGCDRFLEVHHIIHWEDNGPTSTWNLLALCPHHHRLHHQGKLGITGNADIPGGVVFTDATGRIITASGAKPTPPGGPPPPITGRYRHPLNERFETKWIHFAPPADRPAQRPEHPPGEPHAA